MTTNVRLRKEIKVYGSPEARTPEVTNAVLDALEVETDPRYTPRDTSGNGKIDTHCDCFLWDASRALRAEIPNEVDADGNHAAPRQGRELSAKGMIEWLATHGVKRFGWTKAASPAQAQELADLGLVVVATWINPKPGSSHVAVVRPTPQGAAPGRVWIAQAGRTNLRCAPLERGFGLPPTSCDFYVHT